MENTTTYLLISAVSALLLGILKIMYSSKCSKINCCFGVVDITCEIKSEVEEDKYRIESKNEVIVTDGVTSWSYYKKKKQVVIDNYKKDGNTFSPNKFQHLEKSSKKIGNN